MRELTNKEKVWIDCQMGLLKKTITENLEQVLDEEDDFVLPRYKVKIELNIVKPIDYIDVTFKVVQE